MKKHLILWMMLGAVVGCNSPGAPDKPPLEQSKKTTVQQKDSAEVNVDTLSVDSVVENPTKQTTQSKKQSPPDSVQKIVIKKPVILSPFRNLIISNGRVGTMRPGMSIKEIFKKFNKGQIKKENQIQEGKQTEVYNVYNRKSKLPALSFYPEAGCEKNCKVARIVLFDPAIKTKTRIGAGTKIGALKQKFPGDIYVTTQGSSAVVYIKLEGGKTAFVLESFSIDWNPDGKYSIDDIPDEIKIVSVHLIP